MFCNCSDLCNSAEVCSRLRPLVPAERLTFLNAMCQDYRSCSNNRETWLHIEQMLRSSLVDHVSLLLQQIRLWDMSPSSLPPSLIFHSLPLVFSQPLQMFPSSKETRSHSCFMVYFIFYSKQKMVRSMKHEVKQMWEKSDGSNSDKSNTEPQSFSITGF